MKNLLKINILKKRKKIIIETAEQVKADFAMFGFEIEFTINDNFIYDTLFNQTHLYINELINKGDTKLFSLLYYIDINEDNISNAQITHPDCSLSEIISELILYRELKKVATRLYFKENPEKLHEL